MEKRGAAHCPLAIALCTVHAHPGAGVNATALLAGNTVTLDTVIATAGSGGKFSLLLDNTDVYANCNGHCHCDIDEHHDTNRHRHRHCDA